MAIAVTNLAQHIIITPEVALFIENAIDFFGGGYVMIKLFLLIVIYICLINNSYAATKWIAFDNGRFYIEDTISRDDKGIASFWIKYHGSNEDKFGRKIAYLNIDCLNKEIQIESHVTYSKSGEVLSSFTEKQRDWNKIIPDSIMESAYERVCPTEVTDPAILGILNEKKTSPDLSHYTDAELDAIIETGNQTKSWEAFLNTNPLFADENSKHRRYADYLFDTVYIQRISSGELTYIQALNAAANETYKILGRPTYTPPAPAVEAPKPFIPVPEGYVLESPGAIK